MKKDTGSLTGPEYYELYQLLEKDCRERQKWLDDPKYKDYVKWVMKSTLEHRKKLLEKMGRRMDQFDPAFRHTCW